MTSGGWCPVKTFNNKMMVGSCSRFQVLREETSGRLIDWISQVRKEAVDAFPFEYQCATLIQSCFRTYRTRKRFLHIKAAIVTIQAVYRGHIGRKLARKARSFEDECERLNHLHHHAVNIQRIFRGYWSRKWRGCHRKLMSYVETVVARSGLVTSVRPDDAPALLSDISAGVVSKSRAAVLSAGKPRAAR